MSQFNNLQDSQVQSSDSENQQPSISTSHNPQNAVSSHESTTANGDACDTLDTCHVTYPMQSHQDTPVQINHPTIFFFRPPNDFYHYHVICKEIPYDVVECLLNKPLNGNGVSFNENECIFFYQQKCNDRFYQISCEIVPPLLVNNCLSMYFLGFELQHQNMEQEHLTFTLDRKAQLERHLKKYLSQYLLS